MIDYLVSFVQCLCLLGYVYGAWLVIIHKADSPIGGREVVSRQSASQAGNKNPAWHRYAAYDW